MRIIFVLLSLLAFWSVPVFPAGLWIGPTDTFVAEVNSGTTSIHIVSPSPGFLVATVNDHDMTLSLIGKVGGNSPGTINFTISDTKGIVGSAVLDLSDAERGSFHGLSAVAEALGEKAAFRIADATLRAVKEGKIPETGAYFLLAAVGGIASQLEDGAKAAWPWDYAAYAVCYYSCVGGCGPTDDDCWMDCGPICHGQFLD